MSGLTDGRRDVDDDPLMHPTASENLLGEKDSSVVVTICTWDRAEDWKEWENSRIREQLYNEAEAILEDKPQIQMYRVVATQRWG